MATLHSRAVDRAMLPIKPNWYLGGSPAKVFGWYSAGGISGIRVKAN